MIIQACVQHNLIASQLHNSLRNLVRSPGVRWKTSHRRCHVSVNPNGIPETGGTWADFGSGTDAFTLALAEIVGRDAHLYSIDQQDSALRQQKQTMRRTFPELKVEYIVANYTKSLDLPNLDGIVMANTLHFQRHKDGVLQLVYRYLRPGGAVYPGVIQHRSGQSLGSHPFSYESWATMAHRNGFVDTQLLAIRPSRFMGEIYAAASRKPMTPPVTMGTMR